MKIEEAKELRKWLDELESVQCEISKITGLQSYSTHKINLHASGSGNLLIELDDGDKDAILDALWTRRTKRENELTKMIERFEK